MQTRSKLPLSKSGSLPTNEDRLDLDKENLAPAAASSLMPLVTIQVPKIAPIKAAVKRDWDDLDAEDAEDPLMVSEYVVEIFDYMKCLEVL